MLRHVDFGAKSHRLGAPRSLGGSMSAPKPLDLELRGTSEAPNLDFVYSVEDFEPRGGARAKRARKLPPPTP